jgi:hypothetical protein
MNAATIALTFVLIANGLAHQADVARQNLAFDISRTSTYPDIVAAQWIRGHVPAGAVVMARQWDVTYHYADRRIVWFPPSTDADLLLDGIFEHHVDFVVVVTRGKNAYWRPDDARCFQSLVDRYPGYFTVVQSGTNEKVYAVVHRDVVAHTG